MGVVDWVVLGVGRVDWGYRGIGDSRIGPTEVGEGREQEAGQVSHYSWRPNEFVGVDVSAPFPQFALHFRDSDGRSPFEGEELTYISFCGGEGVSCDRLLEFVVEVSEELPLSGLASAVSSRVVKDDYELCARHVLCFTVIIRDLVATIGEASDRAAVPGCVKALNHSAAPKLCSRVLIILLPVSVSSVFIFCSA